MSRSTPDWKSIEAPAAIDELVVTPDRMQLFMFSAVTWNRHHIHYSKDAALEEGLPDVVVHRALLGNFLARMLTDWLGDHGEIRELSWKVLQSALPGKPLRCQGVVIAKSSEGQRRGLTCDVKIVNEEGQSVAAGSALLELFETAHS
jgi:hydroxyacyl-ACP dehydratase HTD2-like protein with hotdog domain